MTSASLHPSPPVSERVGQLDRIARSVVAEHAAAPCAVVACACRVRGEWRLAEGAAGHLAPGGPAATPSTVFDLASVTKPLTALALARLVRSGLVELDTELGVLVREAQGTPSARVALELLLAHRSGLDGHRPLYAPLERGRAVDRFLALAQAAAARRPECSGEPPAGGFAPVYSDLGYLLLGEAMARAAGQPLDKLVEREVCAPLGLAIGSARRWRERDGAFDDAVAPTEVVGWRGGLVRGVVHDENAWALGGDAMCGHAGLFGRASDVARLGAAVLDVLAGRVPGWLEPNEIEPLLRRRPGGTLRAGFDGKSVEGSSAGALCSRDAFGHLGFTGSSLWIDPASEAAVTLLCNRVHPNRDNERIKCARPVAHQALFLWASERRA